MSFEVLVQKRLVLPDDETTCAAGTDCSAASLIVDSQASLVALATQHDLPLFSGGVTANPSGLVVRAGQGIASTVNISRLARSLGENPPRFESDVSNARDLVLGKKVAAKYLSRRNDIDLSKKLGSMAKEIRILGQARLRVHENLVRLIGVDWEGTHTDDPESKSRWPLLLMEYADCGTLTDFFTLDIDINWDVKANIAYDLASGLEALDDAGVTHGDLTLSNVLMFRTGDATFRAKLCDFGFAMIATDYDDVPIRQFGFTPPWDAPESSQDIEIDDLYKIDIYGYGLLVCRIFLHGGDPFELKYQSEKSRLANSKAACIAIWKVSDKVVDIAKDMVRRYPDLEYTKDQLTILDDIFALTLRTAPELRADEYTEIKKVIRPNAADEEAHRREQFSWETIASETVGPLFSGSLINSIPEIEQCWYQLLPRNIMCEIVKDLQRLSSIGKATNVESDAQIHAAAAAAAYQLALCYIQGLGCDISYTMAADWLVFSADLGCVKARRDLYRLTEAMGIPIPSRIRPMVLEWTLSNANQGIEQAYEDLLLLDPKLASTVSQQARTVYGGLGFDIFTPEIRNSYSLDDPETFISRLTSANELIPFESIDGEGLTWLHYGASIGSLEAIRRMIERPLDDINCTTNSGSWTPIWMACAAGNLDVALFLLKAGADPAIPSDTGRTCLHHLQAFPVGGVEEIAAKLLDAGANIEAKDHDMQETPLHSACLQTRGPDAVTAVRALIQSGADPCSLSRDGRSPIDIAAMKLRPDILHALLSSSRFSGVAGETLKSQVKAQALSALIKQLKVHRLRNGGSRLADNMRSVLNALISRSTLAAYVQAHPEGYHPLQDACIWGSTDMIESLLSHPDIEINPTPPEGFAHKAKMNPLFNSIQTGNVNLVKIFLSCGADVTVVDRLGRNILHMAAEFMPGLAGEFIQQLRDRGCDIGGLVNSGTEANGYTPFDVAVQREHFDCADLLLGYGAKYDNFSRPGLAGELYTSLQYASGSRRQLSYLLELALPDKKPSLVVCDNGFTLFHLAAASFDNALLETDPSSADNVTFLLDHYATPEDANQADHQGSTPLHVAAYFGNTAVAQVLLEGAEADVNATSRTGATPLDALIARERDQGSEQEELRLVDDLEKRTWERRTEDMRTLLLRHVAVGGCYLENKQAEQK